MLLSMELNVGRLHRSRALHAAALLGFPVGAYFALLHLLHIFRELDQNLRHGPGVMASGRDAGLCGLLRRMAIFVRTRKWSVVSWQTLNRIAHILYVFIPQLLFQAQAPAGW